MPGLTPHTRPTKLILAFDIGTTYSSVSYCILEPHQVPEVFTVERFPGQGVARADAKVPSLLYYDKTGTVRAAGAEVLVQDVIERALSEGWAKAEWWKLHLFPKYLASSIYPEDDLPPLPSGKSAVDILTDFIKYLFDCCKTYIERYHPGFTWSSVERSIEYILTYPSGLGEHKCSYSLAIKRAGLVPSTSSGQHRVHLLTEGEAALQFCVSRLLNGETTNEGGRQGVVIIDAGGGIIDLGMFSVTSKSNPMSYEEIAPAESRLEGSIFVTRRAKALIERKLEGWEYSSAEDVARFTREFDQKTKPVIENDQEPAYVRVAGRRTNSPKHCISSGELTLSGEEATGLFNDSVDAIIGAFERFAITPIATAFLVGGLSTNEWIWSRLQSYFMARKIRIYRPNSHSNKVVAKGAVLSRVCKTIRKKRILRKAISNFCGLDNHINKVVDNGAVLSLADCENLWYAPKVAHSEYDMIVRDLWRTKAEKADLERTVESFRVQKESSNRRIAHLEQSDMELRALLGAHEQKHQCEALYGQGRIKEATESLIKIANTASEVVRTNELIVGWITVFQRRCVERLEKLGDDAMDSKNYDEAIEYFSTMLSLNPRDRIDILIKRGKARASMNSWEEALSDANEVIVLDPSCYRGHEMRYTALNGARRYAEAVKAFDAMLSKIKDSPDADVRLLCDKYIDARPTIQRIVEDTVNNLPHVLIDIATGRLRDRSQQMEAFTALPIYSELVLSMTTQLDGARIQEAVREFYQYVMFSHRWEKDEPLHQEVKNISIYKLEASPANTKLTDFCRLVRSLGYPWAWSDNSCVDRSNSVILQESLFAMFMWYHRSSLTVVYLRGVSSKSQQPGDLWRSIWNTRVWTYQEYVAAVNIQFYTEDWKPYLGLTVQNHKESPTIISEMQQATGVSAKEMAVLRPGQDRVREKLYLASRRETTLVEDIAYSLFGIFGVTIQLMYGEGKRAVGRLLEYILTGSGDATILAWTGSVGNYNSCLPMDLTVYDPLVPPHVPRPIEKAEMDRIIMESRLSMADSDLSLVKTLHNQLSVFPQPSLIASRLTLRCIVFPLTELAHAPDPDPVTKLHIYCAATATFGDVEIKTADDLTGMKGLHLVHPWVRPLLDQEFWCGATTLDKTTQALRLAARLRQPFGALLFVQLAHAEYRRVATDCLIMVQIREEVSLTQLMCGIRTIEVQ